MAERIIKYPRTQHLEGSRLGPGDEDLSQVPFASIFGKNIVIEEKIDGANCAISFDSEGNLLLQSRGHFLLGGHREKHYNLLKQWANLYQDVFFDTLGTRYIMYGEWMYAKHTVFYDALPSYFMEFDIYDKQERVFLDTDNRRALTEQMGIVSSVPVLDRGRFSRKEPILALIGHSKYITDRHLDVLREVAEKMELDPVQILRETDPSTTMEGLYFKLEENGIVEGRLKFVRPSFLQCIVQSQTHWLARPIIPNQLKDKNAIY